MARSVVRGTPVHHVDARGGQGEHPGTPAKMDGTVHDNYSSETGGYRRDGRSGTPYHSERGNPPGERRERLRSTNAESSDHGNQNDPERPRGVVLGEGAGDYRRGYEPKAEPTLDSPVPRDAPVFDTDFIPTEDRMHMGRGSRAEGTANPDLVEIGGVMSRGMEEGDKPGGLTSEDADDRG